MKLLSTIHRADTAVLLSSLLISPLPAAAMFQCDKVVVDSRKYNLGALGGPHSVVMSRLDEDNVYYNTTYTLDICGPLKKSGGKSDESCKNGSRVCAIERKIEGDQDTIIKVIPVAGKLENYGGGPLDDEKSPLKTADPDLGLEGIRVTFKGGFYELESGAKRKQRAVIDFVCDEGRDGLEGEYDPEDKYERKRDADVAEPRAVTDPLLYRAEDDEEGGGGDDGEGGEDGDNGGKAPKDVQLGVENDPSLIFKSYAPMAGDSNIDVLHLQWSSKYVCDSGEDDDEPTASSHWGFFTWLVVLIFLGTATYLIFGSWLNYNRYGARGWDLLPHGDTIRDVPYLLKDWTRRVLNTVQGSGSRGGYSAV